MKFMQLKNDESINTRNRLLFLVNIKGSKFDARSVRNSPNEAGWDYSIRGNKLNFILEIEYDL